MCLPVCLCSGDGEIDFDEFMTMMKRHEAKSMSEDAQLKQAFEVFDKDGSYAA